MASQSQPLHQTTEREATLLDRIAEKQAIDATRYKPVMSVDESIERYHAIEKFVRECMQDGIDYGKPPGFPKESKPFLYKPGAQKLCAFFGYVPVYEEMGAIEEWTEAKFGEPLFYYKLRCTLSKNREPVGEGIGSCNTWETKYRYRNSSRTCPECGAEAIIKGKQEYGGGFVCFAKKGGCGAKFQDDAPEILEQEIGKVANPDIADTINTVQKQAEKRAYVEAVLSATGASAFFSQDEDVVKAAPKKATRNDTAQGKQDQSPAEPGPAAAGVPPTPAVTLDPRPIPEELKDAVGKIRLGDLGVIATADNFLKVAIIEACGTDGPYLKETEAFRKRYPKGQKFPYEAVVSLWLDMYAIIESARFAQEVNG
jgi:hypothetical protein